MATPGDRIRTLTSSVSSTHDHACSRRRAGAEYVLYWMVSFRRLGWNFALERAVEHATALELPLLVFEPLRVAYPWASDRHHRFILDGIAEHRDALASHSVGYFPYVEDKPDAGQGLLDALAKRAAVVVSDDYPAFFIPRMHRAAAERIDAPLELVDSNGLLPMHSTERVFTTAYSFRAYLQKNLQKHLQRRPKPDPLCRVALRPFCGVPQEILERWPRACEALLDGDAQKLAALPIDHAVGAVDGVRGGESSGRRLAQEFVHSKLDNYPDARNQPDRQVTSELSPYLHYGHVSTHQVFDVILEREASWRVEKLPAQGRGSREGWWQMSSAAEAFLDEIVTWRELGLNMASHWGQRYQDYESLPDWALKTLDDHRNDERQYVYSLQQFEAAETHDELWNAAQRQLLREGRIHNYLRMLWGKKILEWTRSPEDALGTMVELNNTYALDGRDPNSYSGIMWVLGRYDRAWGPERPIFGKVRYMSSNNTARKVKTRGFVERYGP